MTSSCNKILKFIQASRFKYVSASDYFLVKGTDSYRLYLKGDQVKWQPAGGFHTVAAAEKFINSRDYVNASVDFIDIASDDFAYILEAYAFKQVGENEWATKINRSTVFLTLNDDEIMLSVEAPSKHVDVRTFSRLDDLMLALDAFYESEDIYTSSAIKIGQYVSAAINVRDLAKNLVRVRSSNVWAYGMNLRDRKDKAGEVLVQFKGKNGGPGDIYIYYDVPLVVWRKWLSATSKGHYFWQYIRNTYAYSKLTGDKRGKLRNAINR